MRRLMLAACALVALAAASHAAPQDAVIAALEAQAKSADAGFKGFTAENGKALFMATHQGGKPDKTLSLRHVLVERMDESDREIRTAK